MTGIINGQIADADEVMNALGSLMKDTAQAIYNTDYVGLSSKLNGNGTLNLKNAFYSTFEANDASTVAGFDYDATNDRYNTSDLSAIGNVYVIIEADDSGVTWTQNDCVLTKISTGKWILYCDTGTDNVKRAQIHKSLWYGTTGADQLILDFSNMTSLKTSDSGDVGKNGHFAEHGVLSGTLTSGNGTYTGTFADTSTNAGCSSWSNIWDANGSSLEMGLDKTADEVSNPANCQLERGPTSTSRWEIPSGSTRNTRSGFTANGHDCRVIIVASGDITWVPAGGATYQASVSNIDFATDHSIPDFEAAGTLAEEGLGESSLIFKSTASATVTNAFMTANYDIDATSSIVFDMSADGGVNWDVVTDSEINRFDDTGTAFWRRVTITRTDLSKVDKVFEQFAKYNLY